MTDQESKQVGKIYKETTVLARKTQDRIHLLNRESAEMAQIIEVLTEISEHTNLLAVNVLLEANRKNGTVKKFAVVLTEITQLASQTAMATSEIKERVNLICNSAKESTHDIAAMTEAISRLQKIIDQQSTFKKQNNN